jgi:hypothetical protein
MTAQTSARLRRRSTAGAKNNQQRSSGGAPAHSRALLMRLFFQQQQLQKLFAAEQDVEKRLMIAKEIQHIRTAVERIDPAAAALLVGDDAADISQGRWSLPPPDTYLGFLIRRFMQIASIFAVLYCAWQWNYLMAEADFQKPLTDPDPIFQVNLDRLTSLQQRSYTNDVIWWQNNGSRSEIATQLKQENVAVLDNFMGAKVSQAVLAEIETLYASGQPKLGGGLNDFELLRDRYTGWIDTDDVKVQALMAVQQFAQHLDTLVKQLRYDNHTHEDLKDVHQRGRLMLAVHPDANTPRLNEVEDPQSTQSRFDAKERHTDNDCLGSRGTRCNGRRLTALYYLHRHWDETFGGKFRVFGPDKTYQLAPSKPRVDLSPNTDRLIIFWADKRVPHLVTAIDSGAPARLCLTAFYHSDAELTEYRRTGGLARLKSFKGLVKPY